MLYNFRPNISDERYKVKGLFVLYSSCSIFHKPIFVKNFQCSMFYKSSNIGNLLFYKLRFCIYCICFNWKMPCSKWYLWYHYLRVITSALVINNTNLYRCTYSWKSYELFIRIRMNYSDQNHHVPPQENISYPISSGHPFHS